MIGKPYNQSLMEKKEALEEVLKKKMENLEMKRKWVKELELETESIENEINAIDSELRQSQAE